MKIRIVCTGKLKERFYTEAVGEFMKRLTRYCDPEIIELPDEKVPESPSAAEIALVKEAECRRMAEKLSPADCVIALDPRGKQLTSEEFSALLASLMVGGKSRVSFLIGGSHGLTDGVRSRADEVISFSKMTFPHQIFRIMLLEQIYRAFKIQSGEPYHK
ncbi:MAG: 23S rRNA (pseudouridine(1915)-N(3))-methyltransferase RlmH [Clostridiales bacterium]|nr:23S rRNA (pseudouridine(1915)-N(3))-methyltransferase RlmH [Clostridiales bacterium]